MTKPLNELVEVMSCVKDGDLTRKANVNTTDEIGDLADNFNHMLDQVAQMMSKSKAVAHQVATSAVDLAANSEEVSASSDEVSRTVEEIATGAGDQAGEAEKGMISAFLR